MLKEIHEAQRDNHHMISLVYGIWVNYFHERQSRIAVTKTGGFQWSLAIEVISQRQMYIL